MAKDIISFDVGTNFDYKLFDIIREQDKNHNIRSLFGKLKHDGMPGGRNSSVIPEFSMDQFADYLKECQKNDLTFNYLINPLSLDDHDTDPFVGKQIHDFIHTLYDMGVRAVTLNSPILIQYVKRNFPDMFVTLGLYAYPTNLKHIEYWRNWGVDEITLDHSFNRNFEMLRKVLTLYKDTDLHLRVIANNLCLKECPFRLGHGSFSGHTDPNRTSMDYYLINCAYKKISNPTALMTSEWIRPEDIHYYRELAEETGNKNFSIKLVDRTRTTEFLENVITAYMTEKYDGNLLDILNWIDSKKLSTVAKGQESLDKMAANMPQMANGAPTMSMPPQGMPQMPNGMPPMGGMPAGVPPMMPPQGMPQMPNGMPPMGGMQAGAPPMMPPQGMPQTPNGMPPMGGMPKLPNGMPPLRFMEVLKPEAMMNYGRTMNWPNIYLDNNKLDGFLEHFMQSDCSCKVCADSILPTGEQASNACAHCSVWAKKAITFDENEVNQWKQFAEATLKGLEDGTIYR